MRRAVNNNLQPFKRGLNKPDTEQKYQDRGAMVFLDLCFWKGSKDLSIADYVEMQERHISTDCYYLQLGQGEKPQGYSGWSHIGNGVEITQQSLPFGGHLHHLAQLKASLSSKGDVVLSVQHGSTRTQRQALW